MNPNPCTTFRQEILHYLFLVRTSSQGGFVRHFIFRNITHSATVSKGACKQPRHRWLFLSNEPTQSVTWPTHLQQVALITYSKPLQVTPLHGTALFHIHMFSHFTYCSDTWRPFVHIMRLIMHVVGKTQHASRNTDHMIAWGTLSQWMDRASKVLSN